MPTLGRHGVSQTLSPIPMPLPSVFSGMAVPSTYHGKPREKKELLANSCSCLSMVIQTVPGHREGLAAWRGRAYMYLMSEGLQGSHPAVFLRPLLPHDGKKHPIPSIWYACSGGGPSAPDPKPPSPLGAMPRLPEGRAPLL